MSLLTRLETATAVRTEASQVWDRLIERALAEGLPVGKIAKAAGVSHVAISKKRAKAAR